MGYKSLENKVYLYAGDLDIKKVLDYVCIVDILYENELGIGGETLQNLEGYIQVLTNLDVYYKVKVYCELKQQGRIKEARYFWQEFILMRGNKQATQNPLRNRGGIPKDFELIVNPKRNKG